MQSEIDRRPPPNQAHLRYRPDIDGLRAIAVLPVILYHYSLGCPGGYVGVDVFYVISGFLITKIIYDLVLERRFSFVEFYDRRIRRLFPALFVMLATVTIWAAIKMIWFDLADYGASLLASTVYLSNVYFYVTTGYFMQAAATKPLLHTWSLAVEEQFYIVVPFILFAMVRTVPRRWHAGAILGLSVVSLALCIVATRIDTPGAFYLLPPRAWELGIGGALAIAAPPVWRYRWLTEALGIVGLLLIIYAVFALSDATPFPGWHALIPTIGAAAILSSGGGSGGLVESMLGARPFAFVGKISYSLYLWHWPIIVAFDYAAAPTLSKEIAALALTFVLASISWRFIELPFRNRRVLPTAKQLFIGSAAASVVATAIGGLLLFANGFPHPRSLVRLVEQKGLGEKRPDCAATVARATTDHLCIRGARNVAPSFVFVGDSHAAALSDGLFKAAASSGVAGVQFSNQAFVPLPGRRSLTTRRPMIQGREDLTPSFLAFLKRHRELQTVILTAFWTHEATGRSYRNAQEIDVDDAYDGSGPAYNPTSLRHSLSRLVEMFPDRQFIILDDVPGASALDLRNFARLTHAGRTPPRGMTRAGADAERASYEPILKAIAESHRNVRYEPILSALCTPRLCPLFRHDGLPIFRDGDHLSYYGSTDLAPALTAIFTN